MAKSKWDYYQWQAMNFWSDYRLNGVSGLSIGILRAFHDHLWQSPQKEMANDATIPQRLRITREQWQTSLQELIASGLLYRDTTGLLRSPHIDECWEHCQHRSAIYRANKEGHK